MPRSNPPTSNGPSHRPAARARSSVRRIAEIRDGLLALRAYDDPGTAARLHREIYQSGRRANQPVPQLVPSENPLDDARPPTYDVLSHYFIGGATPEAEAHWLTQVSRALDRTRE